MSKWTLRGGAPSPFRQARPQEHPAARRARAQVDRRLMGAIRKATERRLTEVTVK